MPVAVEQSEPNERQAAGKAVVAEMLGAEFAERIAGAAGSRRFGAAAAALALEFAFGSVWTRDGLARRDRSLVTIGMLIGSGRNAELKNHVRAGLNNGLDSTALQEVVVQAIPYCGFPAAAEAADVVMTVLREAGLLEADQTTSKERGLR